MWRLVLEGKGAGRRNMAVDETLFLHYSSFRLPTLRVYGWKEPVVSLGYNQPVEVIRKQFRLPLVRRMTGGAAIVHADEVTYSLVCASSDLGLPKKIKESYKGICSFLITFYARLGLRAEFARDVFPAPEQAGLGRYGNWCFSSFEHYDLIINNRKIGGSAQRRRKDIIFQHGSIPQSLILPRINPAATGQDNIRQRATSLNKELDSTTDYAYLASLLAESFRQTFNVEFKKGGLTKEEAETADSLLKDKYGAKAWNYRR